MVTTSIWHIEQKPELIEALGRVTVRWASLDLMLVHIAAVALKNMPAAQSCIFGNHNAGHRRFTAFEQIIGASFFEQDERATILSHMARLRSLYSKRNSLTHEPLDGKLTIDGKKLRFDLAFVTREGETREAKLDDIHRHVAEVDIELEALESVWEILVEKYEPEETGD